MSVLKKKKKNLPRPQSELELVVLWAVILLERQWFTISGTDVTAENNCQMIKKKKTKLICVIGTLLWSLKLMFIAS